jgi:hypothetical protein
MTSREQPTAGTQPPTEYYRAHAKVHARENASGIGAAVVETSLEGTRHVWDCIVTDGHEWHYIRVLSSDLGPFQNLSAEEVEQAMDRFAATLPAEGRLRHLLNANPLHLTRDGTVRD